ncbi:MAG: CARDB domain-containing protein [Candidatus Altiarchaeota archaeon]
MKRILFALMLLSAFSSAELVAGKVVVMANSIDGGQASGLYSHLEDNGITVVKADSRSFDIVKDMQYIIILGGQGSPEGVGLVSAEILSDSEEESLITAGAYHLFRKDGQWSPNQTVLVAAGYGGEDTRLAWAENMDAIFGVLSAGTPAGIVISSPDTVFIQKMNNLREYSFPVNVSNNGTYEANQIGVKAYLNGGLSLSTDPEVLNLLAGQSQKVLIQLNPKVLNTGDTVSVEVGGRRVDVKINVTDSVKAGLCLLCNRGD